MLTRMTISSIDFQITANWVSQIQNVNIKSMQTDGMAVHLYLNCLVKVSMAVVVLCNN